MLLQCVAECLVATCCKALHKSSILLQSVLVRGVVVCCSALHCCRSALQCVTKLRTSIVWLWQCVAGYCRSRHTHSVLLQYIAAHC